MDEQTFKARVARLNEVGSVIAKLPEEIRNSAFALLSDYITQISSKKGASPNEEKANNENASDMSREEFFQAFDHSKPSDNVRLIAAYLYREHGIAPFSVEEVVTVSNDVGLTLPNRVDMTIRSAQANGKNLFTPTSSGYFKVTVHGEAYLKETYKVKKGNKQKAAA